MADFQEAKERLEERIRKTTGVDKSKAKEIAERTRDRVERSHDEGTHKREKPN